MVAIEYMKCCVLICKYLRYNKLLGERLEVNLTCNVYLKSLTVIHYHGEKCKDFKINVILTWKY
ncbi:hypothetical protein V1478_007092 [Vespula squamosa]|uniref:Uncharacterized protein n=1 Tax=Vespula squamosa TaxID=30214 RepID=A0ABD2B269_VESSQ